MKIWNYYFPKQCVQKPNNPICEGELYINDKTDPNYFVFEKNKMFYFKDKKNSFNNCKGILLLKFSFSLSIEWIFEKKDICGFIIWKNENKLNISCSFYSKNVYFLNEIRKIFQKSLPLFNFYQYYLPEKQLGKGHFASVLMVRNIKTEKKFAAKKFKLKKFSDNKDSSWELIENEINVMRKYSHNNLCELIEVAFTKKSIYLVMPLYWGGRLTDYIRKKKKLSEDETLRILKNLLDGLQYFHDLKYIHRDIKPENIIFPNGDFRELFLVDFGLAVSTTEKVFTHKRCGTPGYVAPEIMEKGVVWYNDRCDIFSLGAVIYHMLVGEKLFRSSNRKELFNLNIECNIEEKLTKKEISKKMQEVLRGMLEKNPLKRYSINDVIFLLYSENEIEENEIKSNDFDKKMLELKCNNTIEMGKINSLKNFPCVTPIKPIKIISRTEMQIQKIKSLKTEDIKTFLERTSIFYDESKHSLSIFTNSFNDTFEK